ncbi:MAG TPA: hypothetical protein VN112_01410 [Ensifer sp.]|nr:hypothetical protein [Ensifer sp.]
MNTDELQSFITKFATAFADVHDKARLDAVGNAFLDKLPPERMMDAAAQLYNANPFFLPRMDPEEARNMGISTEILAQVLMRASLTARHAKQANILVACAPKSASTFIAGALAKAGRLPVVPLIHTMASAATATLFGINNREQEIDQLALLRAGLNGRGYVTQHHTRCTPYLCHMLETLNVRPVVTYRNIFDSLVSVDDMITEAHRSVPAERDIYAFDGLPKSYRTMERAERLYLLAVRMTYWYVSFYVSWRKCEADGLVAPLWVSYDEDFLGDRDALASRVSTFIGPEYLDPDILAAHLKNDRAEGMRVNIGRAGRGKDVPDDVRDMVMRIANSFRSGGIDVTPLVGE